MRDVSPEERERSRSLAQELHLHGLEVSQLAQQDDVKSARSHLKHVVWKALKVLRSSVLKPALADDKAVRKREQT